MVKVLVTDHTFEDLAVERGILKPLGCKVVEQKKFTTEEDLIKLVSDADYVITQFAPVNEEVIGAMKNCRVISRYGIGVDNVDLRAAAAKGIPVCNIPDYCTDEVADHTLALILSTARQICSISSQVKAGSKINVPLEMVKVLSEMSVGVIGFGRIGREVVNRLKPFKCKISVFDPVVKPATVESEGLEYASYEDILKTSDLITFHCPSTVKTRHMLNADALKLMKKGAVIVNASRGDLIKTDDFVEVLKNGHIGAAALDVTDPEPLPAGHPLLQMSNVAITNHYAAASVEAVEKLRIGVTEPIRRLIQGEKLINIVNGVSV